MRSYLAVECFLPSSTAALLIGKWKKIKEKISVVLKLGWYSGNDIACGAGGLGFDYRAGRFVQCRHHRFFVFCSWVVKR